jgi:hypothetical protein
MRNRKWIFFVAPPAVVLFVALGGYIVESLWNWLVPALFAGAHLITFWQALGLLILCRILFGSWGGSGSRHRRRNGRLTAMTPEELEQFREKMRGRCGNFGQGPTETTRPAGAS